MCHITAAHCCLPKGTQEQHSCTPRCCTLAPILSTWETRRNPFENRHLRARLASGGLLRVHLTIQRASSACPTLLSTFSPSLWTRLLQLCHVLASHRRRTWSRDPSPRETFVWDLSFSLLLFRLLLCPVGPCGFCQLCFYPLLYPSHSLPCQGCG